MEHAPSEEHAAAHIALYFRWCLEAGFLSEDHTEDEELVPLLEKIRIGELSATDYLWDNTSGKLGDVDFTEECNRFTKRYFPKRYYGDLRTVTGLGDYEFTENEVDFAKLKALLDRRIQDWREAPPRRPWWKLWG